MKASTGTPKDVLTSICVNQAMMVFLKKKWETVIMMSRRK
jgi:hypothetical protein